ncbi:PqqD family protein [Oscillatoria sp. FACHB-1406]|uniref:PqqD family protein n=1 Tax=Oscillatoria sp. FACHB-1406 TaxID=2692846 RepID=UPI00168946BB|nr:PqqD family protein [Oscillatoria sp. FACHB-1406]MBD2577740.1 PqqD family protein [Oscillatoria sp. FACHB-1406]
MSQIEFAQRVIPIEDVLIQHLEDEAVLLNLDNEAYYGLDDVGTRFFAVLQEANSIESAYQQLLEEYEVEPDTLKKDLLIFIEKLLAQGLIRLSE